MEVETSRALNGLHDRPAGRKVQLVPAIQVPLDTSAACFFRRERVVVIVQHRAEIFVGKNTPVTCVRGLIHFVLGVDRAGEVYMWG